MRHNGKAEASAPFLLLLSVSHPALPKPLLFTSDEVETVSRENTYRPGFHSHVVEEGEEEGPGAITVGQITTGDLAVVRAFGNMSKVEPTILIEWVTAAAADEVLLASELCQLRNVIFDGTHLSAQLYIDAPFPVLSEPLPGALVTS